MNEEQFDRIQQRNDAMRKMHEPAERTAQEHIAYAEARIADNLKYISWDNPQDRWRIMPNAARFVAECHASIALWQADIDYYRSQLQPLQEAAE